MVPEATPALLFHFFALGTVHPAESFRDGEGSPKRIPTLNTSSYSVEVGKEPIVLDMPFLQKIRVVLFKANI